jgi:4'-phosphopantetheinyl transferase EntD
LSDNLFASLVPPGVVVVEVRDLPGHAVQFQPETATVVGAIDKRRRELTARRFCAREALNQLGVPAAPILPGRSRGPDWPEGFVGSITHCAGYAAAAIGRNADFLAIGIDAEVHRGLPAGVLELVSTQEERIHVATLQPTNIPWDRLLFSAKESVYKAWLPLTDRSLGFKDVLVTFMPDRQFAARLLVSADCGARRLACLMGRYDVGHDLVATAVVVPRDGPSAA